MNLLNKLSTKAKLINGTGIIITAIVFSLVISYTSIRKIERLNQHTEEIDHLSRTLVQLRSDENRLRALALELLITKDTRYRDTLQAHMKARTAQTASTLMVIDSSLNSFPDQNSQFKKIVPELEKYNRNGSVFANLVTQGKLEEAAVYVQNVQNPLYESVRLSLLDLEKQLDAIAKQDDNQSESWSSLINHTIVLLGIGVILLCLVLAIFMIGMLRSIAAEIRSAVGVLGTTAADILSTVTEISTGAAETATSVSEITTTVEEVRQTSVVSNQKAQLLLDSSQRAASSVDKGRKSIHEVIVSMKKIDAQMNLISDTVLKLSDQNRTIGEITSSVADIADQSNLLAVNAAIEASKAGEHGRGFTVVAQEIRSLADQSKKATAQVKEILNEINRSVNQAVGVTEQGNKTVEEGSNLVAQSGEVIELLAENVDETAEASIQISSSNQQQMAGMEQVVPAMENIKIASQQNLTGIQQAQAAAHQLNSLGQNLKDIIEKFNL